MQWTALLKEVAGSALVDVVALGAASADGLYALGRLAAQGGSNPIYLLQVDPQGTLQRSVTWADRFEVLDGHGAEWRGRWLQPTASEGRSTIHVGASEIRVAGLYENNFTGGAHSAGTYPSAIVITFDKTLARAASEQFQLETGYTPIASLAALPGPQTGGILAMQEVGTGRAILAELGAPP